MIDPLSSTFLLASCFFLIAALYASVGFGGGSSYLAILSLYLKDFLLIKTLGLLCNLVVVSGGSWIAFRNGLVDKRLTMPLVAGGVPCAFFGAMLHLTQRPFFLILGGVLALSGLLLLLQVWLPVRTPRSRPVSFLPGLLLGSAIGALAGMVGIGGGILLSPVLHLLNREAPRRIAATASVFILLNSVAGLAGQLISGHLRLAMPLAGILLLAVFLGGQLGSRIAMRLISPAAIRGLTGLLVCYIGARLVLLHLPGTDL